MVSALRNKIDFIDATNVELYADFQRPIVALVTNHPSVDDLSRNQDFFKLLASFLNQGGLKKFAADQFDYAIINALEVKDIAYDFQLSTFHPDRNFFLVILKDMDTGYLLDEPIIKEKEDQPNVMTADTIQQFVSQYKKGQLQVYLRTETLDHAPVIKEGVLQVYGSNFVTLVKERRYAPAEEEKALLIFFTKADCSKCDWNEGYFLKLVEDETLQEDFVFAKMDLDKNYPSSDYIKYFYNLPEDEPMLQFLAVLPDGGTLTRFQIEGETFEAIHEFVERVKYLLSLQQPLRKAAQAAEAAEGADIVEPTEEL